MALICAPFAVKNLDDNVILQYLAVIGLIFMAAIQQLLVTFWFLEVQTFLHSPG